jgi:hypothetical protein
MGLGNYVMGIKLADQGLYALGFTGPVPFIGLLIFRLI